MFADTTSGVLSPPGLESGVVWPVGAAVGPVDGCLIPSNEVQYLKLKPTDIRIISLFGL